MKPRILSLALLAALPLAAPPLRADRLSDLRATLERLRGDSPVKAQIVVRRVRKAEDEEKKGGQAIQEVTVVAEQGAQGLQLTWGPPLLAAARKAARQKAANPDVPEQGADLAVLDAEQAFDLLDAAEPLLLDLDRATLVEDKVEPRGGKPTRLLVVTPHDGLSTSDRKALKSREDVLKIWLDDDGVPVALDRNTKLKFSKFLISFSFSRHLTSTFAVSGDRLVAVSTSEDSSGSGLGQSEDTRQTTKVTVLP